MMEHTLRVVDGRMMTLERRLVLIVLAVGAGVLLMIGRMVQRIVQRRDQSTTDQEADGEQGAEETRPYD